VSCFLCIFTSECVYFGISLILESRYCIEVYEPCGTWNSHSYNAFRYEHELPPINLCISANARLTDAIHRSQSYFVVLIAILLSILDILSAIRRFITFLRSSGESFEKFWKIVIKNEEERLVFASEYIGLVEEAEDSDPSKPSYDSVELHLSDENHWPKHQRRHSSEQIVFGTGSPNGHFDDTLHDSKGHQSSFERCGILGRIGQAAIAITERALVVGGFGQLLIGIVTYTGRYHSLSSANG
jgi:hypothetical protein